MTIATVLAVAGCGRTGMYGSVAPSDGGLPADGPRTDGWVPIDGPHGDGQTDGQCAPSCGDLCFELVTTCAAGYPGGAGQCEFDCQQQVWPDATLGCLEGAFCSANPSCATMRDCVRHPNLTCEEICQFAQQCDLLPYDQCLALCDSATVEQRLCASRAVTEDDCQALRDCYFGQPTDCERICDFAIDSCGANMPREECLINCEAQPPAALQCELMAVDAADCYQLAQCFENPPDAPELAITDFYAFAQGPTVYYFATVCNYGARDAGPFALALYYNRVTAPTASQPGDQTRPVGGLPAGACVEAQLQRASTPAGTYRSWAYADVDDQVAEADEANNVAGPFQVQVGGPGPCDAICSFAVFCGVLPDYDQCMQNCPLFPPDEIACAAKAAQDGDCETLQQCLTGPSYLPDLIVASFTADVAGSTVTYRATVCNQGNAPSQGFYLDLYYDLPQPPTVWQFGDDYQPVDALQPLSCRDLTFTRVATPPGAYASWVQVDGDNFVTEVNEDNNIAGPVPVTVSELDRPDLTITSFTASVSQGTVDYQITICNQGQAAAPVAYVDLYYDRSAAPGQYEYGDRYQQVPGLAAGACASIAVSRAGTPAGTYRSWAQVDADDGVTESNEQNNVAGPIQVVVQGPPQGIDLVVQSLTATAFGSTVTYNIVVCNQGQSAASGFRVAIYYHLAQAPTVGQAGDDESHVNGLAAGQCRELTMTRSNTPPGTYSSWAFVDVNGDVAEANEQNNARGPASVTVTTPPPPPPGIDLVMASCHATVFQAEVHYEMVICNNGSQGSGPFIAGVFFDRAQAPAAGQTPDMEQNVSSIPPSGCDTVSLIRTGTPNGTYTSWCLADVKPDVTETDETNNVGGPITVTVSGPPGSRPDLLIQSFLSSVTGTTVTYTLSVCNTGNAAAGAFYVDLYYDRATAPGGGIFGDQSQGLGGLAAQACQTLTFTRTNAPAGAATSWAQADAQNAVSESNEANNVGGPITVTIALPLDCGGVCDWLITSCGLPAFLRGACISLCDGLGQPQQDCVRDAMASGDCTGTWNCLQ